MVDKKREYNLQDVLTGVSLLSIIENFEARISELQRQVDELVNDAKKESK